MLKYCSLVLAVLIVIANGQQDSLIFTSANVDRFTSGTSSPGFAIVNNSPMPGIGLPPTGMTGASSQTSASGSQMQSGMPQMQGGMQQMQGGMPQMQSGMPQMQSGMPQMQSGMPQMQGGMSQMQGGMPQMQGGLLPSRVPMQGGTG